MFTNCLIYYNLLGMKWFSGHPIRLKTPTFIRFKWATRMLRYLFIFFSSGLIHHETRHESIKFPEPKGWIFPVHPATKSKIHVDPNWPDSETWYRQKAFLLFRPVYRPCGQTPCVSIVHWLIRIDRIPSERFVINQPILEFLNKHIIWTPTRRLAIPKPEKLSVFTATSARGS